MANKLLSTATSVIHGQHKLLRQIQQNFPQDSFEVKECTRIFEQLKQQKSYLEGTHFVYNPFPIDFELLAPLKWDVLAHTPSTITQEFKEKIIEKLEKCFAQFWKKIIYACLLTCPFFSSTEQETTTRARHNILFVIFVGLDENFFTLVQQSEKDQHEVIDNDFVVITEMRHFCYQIKNGNVRFLEALFAPPNSIIYLSKEFIRLKSNLPQKPFLTEPFALKCMGQSYGSIAKYHKGEKVFRLKDSTTFYQLCCSLRLLFHVVSALNSQPFAVWEDNNSLPSEIPGLEEAVKSINMKEFSSAYRDKILAYILKTKDSIEINLKENPLPKSLSAELDQFIDQWLGEVRRQDTIMLTPVLHNETDIQYIQSVLDEIGCNPEKICPQQVIALTRAGSISYGLNLDTSDKDYIIIYSESMDKLVCSSKTLSESSENRGKDEEIEYCAYELRLFCEMLLKASIPIFELLLNDQLDFESQFWKELSKEKHKFITEKLILQYLGFVKSHLKYVETGRYIDDPKREQKLLYQALHKIGAVEKLIHGEIPNLRPVGAEKSFIMRVRHGPLEGDISKDNLIKLVHERYDIVHSQIVDREDRFPELADSQFLLEWSLKVRRIQYSSNNNKIIT